MSALKEVQEWFSSQCNGDWEHGAGITIVSLDNPGWSVSINLEDTALEAKTFLEINENHDDPVEWLLCNVKDKQFEGRGGPEQLERILSIFINWAKS